MIIPLAGTLFLMIIPPPGTVFLMIIPPPGTVFLMIIPPPGTVFPMIIPLPRTVFLRSVQHEMHNTLNGIRKIKKTFLRATELNPTLSGDKFCENPTLIEVNLD